MADLVSILYDDLDEEILDKMPEWFKILKKAYISQNKL